MKEGIHPEYHPVIFKDGEWELITRSTLTSKDTREIDGVEHFVINIVVSAGSHPFWTGQQKLVDAAGRLERFNRKYGSALAARKKISAKN